MNLNAPRRSMGEGVWKHNIEVPEIYDPMKPTIVINKCPYTWVESLCFRSKVDWVKRQTTYPATEQHTNQQMMVNGMNIENLAKTWKHFNDTWQDGHGCTAARTMFLRYETLLSTETREDFLEELSDKFGWAKTRDAWQNPSRGTISQSRGYDEVREAYYRKMIPAKLSEPQIECIKNAIGDDMLKRIGYTHFKLTSYGTML